MKTKKILSLLTICALFIAEFGFLSFNNTSIAVSSNKDLSLDTYSKDYYGRQLNEQAWKFYDAMVKMYENDAFEKGLDYDLVANNVVTEEDLIKYATGSTQLLYDMTAARDAFQYDYPEVFWIDWSAISLRVTRNNSGKYFAFLGRGKRDDYFLPGFNAENVDDAINDYNKLLKDAITEIKTEANKDNQNEIDNTKYKLAKAAHDWEMDKMSYKFEYEVKNYNSKDIAYSNARTAYDCFKYGEGVCEAYTRAYKALLDELEIPCVVAGGGYKVSDTQTENHAWNYVEIDGKWYGVDVTHDDDEVATKQSHRYFMVGTAEFFDRRIESGIFSQSMFEFGFPTIDPTSLQNVVEVYNDDNFKVEVLTSEYIEEGDHSGSDKGEVLEDTFRVHVSYNGKNYTDNEKDGKYLLSRFAMFNSATNTWSYTNWGYITPELYPAMKEKETDKYLDLELPQVELIQFSVTDVPPTRDEHGNLKYDELYYKGDPSFLTERTKEFVNNTGNVYKAPPYITKASPIQSVKLGFDQTFKIKLEYDDYFKTTDSSKSGNIKITDVCKPNGQKRNDLITDSQISNVEYHLGTSAEDCAWVSFDFTPSTQFAANEVAYTIEWQGVVGQSSEKAPMPATYAVGNKCDFCSLAGQGIDCNVFAQPELMDTSNVSMEGWKTRDESGKEVDLPEELANADLSTLSHRLTLSTTTISDEQSFDMVDMVEGLDRQTSKTESYNIRMQLCKKQVVNTGNSVRIRLGFPEGTTYDDYLSGRREFKVYHYKYDTLGNITGYEEIPVEVVPQGLILYVDSFSPFTVAGIEVPEEEQQAKANEAKAKVLMLASTEGGYLTCNKEDDNGKIDMERNEEVTIVVHPEEGKTIESATVGTKIVPLADITENGDGTYSFTVMSSDLQDGTTIVYVKLMSSLIVQEDIDEEHGEQVEQAEEDKFTDTTDEDGNGYCDLHPTSATSIETLIAEKTVPGVKVEILDKDGNVVSDKNTLVGTGMKIKMSNELDSDHVYATTEIVVSGDLTGDGLMNVQDVKDWRLGFVDDSLEGAYKMAADYNKNGSTDVNDIKDIIMEIIFTY